MTITHCLGAVRHVHVIFNTEHKGIFLLLPVRFIWFNLNSTIREKQFIKDRKNIRFQF